MKPVKSVIAGLQGVAQCHCEHLSLCHCEERSDAAISFNRLYPSDRHVASLLAMTVKDGGSSR
ncbi:MAG: hypothetical protein PHC68_08510 [Syntrophorhabdaceae bacterium]|nr:hypothetical protein [Syntrophorhabdaceae bacterium]